MKTKKLFLMAAMLLMSVCTFAQNNNTPLKGDVNEDGKVDVADIVAILKIMKDAGGTTGETTGETTYYWYAGQTDPSTLNEISSTVNDTSSPGWREIGNEIGTYTLGSPLWDGSINKITVGATRADTYVALPNNTLKVRDSGGDVLVAYVYQGTKQINGVTYSIYKVTNLKIFNGIVF